MRTLWKKIIAFFARRTTLSYRFPPAVNVPVAKRNMTLDTSPSAPYANPSAPTAFGTLGSRKAVRDMGQPYPDEISHCELCGSPVVVAGSVTKYYLPVGDIPCIEEFWRSKLRGAEERIESLLSQLRKTGVCNRRKSDDRRKAE